MNVAWLFRSIVLPVAVSLWEYLFSKEAKPADEAFKNAIKARDIRFISRFLSRRMRGIKTGL